ncbi:MAG: phosphatase PAP2 family protein [Ruminococcaceae bacterium]|nr:phosphatase PAP2 family protein [Oscillospiraceae bacterium]
MVFLEMIENLRTPFFDNLFLLITRVGEEYVFLLIGLMFIWCIDKSCGFCILISGLLGQVVNQFLKISFKVERPWIKNPNFTPVKSAIPAATGYSFPSGHTQVATTTFGTIAYRYKNKKSIMLLAITLVFLVGGSRMYLGVHYPLDVLFSWLFGYFLTVFVTNLYNKEKYVLLKTFSLIASTSLFIFVLFVTKGEWSIDFSYSTVLNSAKLLGAAISAIICWHLDQKYFEFDISGKPFFQILKLVLGATLVIFIKSTLKTLFEYLSLNELLANLIRYFLIVLFAGLFWPYIFNTIKRKASYK